MKRTQEDIQDELLVLQSQDGEPAALRSLVDRWNPRLSRFAWRMTGHRDAACDIVQDAWLAIVRGLRRLDDPALFRSWAYRIVRNKCVDWTRKRIVERAAGGQLRSTAGTATPDSSSVTDRADELADLRRAMRELPDEQRVILSLHYLDGMSLAEIAHVLSVPVGTVKSRLHHARNLLRQSIRTPSASAGRT